MKMGTTGLGWLVACSALVGTLGCAAGNGADEGVAGDDGAVAQVTATLAVVPADVTCVSFVLTGSTSATKRFTVSPNTKSVKLDLGQLPLGSVSLAPVAHNLACSSVTANSVATWIGQTVTISVVPGLVTDVAVTLRQNVPVGANVDFVGVAQGIGLGYYASYAIMSDGTLRSWGENNNGQLGTGNNTDRLVPGPVLNVTGAKKVAGGNNHACALDSLGRVFCWGAGFYGQLGNNSNLGTSTPTQVNGSGVYKELGCGENHSCALQLSNGTMHCWGDNAFGQLGDYSATQRLVPTYASLWGSGQYDVIVVGERTSFAFGGNESRCDGAATNGQLGMPSGATTEDPSTGWSGCHVDSGARFVIAGDAGPSSSCVVEASQGRLYCSGNNAYGQLGNGTYTSSTTPVAVSGVTNMAAVAMGWTHACALRGDGTLWCWGRNNHGQLGDGTGTTRNVPAQVPGLSGVTQVAAANDQTCVLKSDGSMWCWGNNDYGQLGDGTLANRAIPTRVQL